MLLSNLTKFEAVAARLLGLQVQSAPHYSFMSVKDIDAALRGLELDPSAPGYEEEKKKAEEAQKKMLKEAEEKQKREQEKSPALSRLLDAFEEGATVNSNESAIEAMKRKVNAAQQLEQNKGESSSSNSQQKPQIKRKSNCNFLASVFANVTIIPAGREWFVKPLSAASAAASRSAQQMVADASPQEDGDGGKADAIEYPVARIMVFTEHPDLIRRGGVISALK